MMFVPVEKERVNHDAIAALIVCRLDAPITAQPLCDRSFDRAPKVGHDEYRDEPRSNIVAPSRAQCTALRLLKARMPGAR